MPQPAAARIDVANPSGRRDFYEQALRASEQLQGPQGLVAMVLLEVNLAPGSEHLSERILQPVTSKLANLFNRRLRSVDMLVRTADTELAVLLAHAHLGVAAAFSERLRQPIEQALREMELATDIVVCMGLAANPPANVWRPDALIELADFRMRSARQRAAESATREWALEVDGESAPQAWADSELWPATSEMNSNSSL
jgi:GGDEF domain-containing protein